MLSTEYRLRLEEICRKVILDEHVSIEEMIWAQKLCSVNRSAATMMRQARRKAENPNMADGSMDDFLNRLDIGGTGHERFGRGRFRGASDIAEWFKRDDAQDWRQRD